MKNIEELRKQINAIDEKMAKLFEERMECAKEIAKYKQENNLPILDQNRENSLISKNLSYVQDELKIYYEEYLKKTIELSKKYQEKIIKKDK
ncbi:MAG: chorismate mutase [Bacilli bacterium]|nr:chorismate mutase [Bacilli bacterium]